MADARILSRPTAWVPWAALALFLAIALVYWLAHDAGPREQAKLYHPAAQDLLVVPYDGRLWVPDDRQPLALSDQDMIAVGEQVGVTLFARPADSLGGGGGMANVAEPPGVSGRYYLKLDDDRYVRLEPQDQWAPQ